MWYDEMSMYVIENININVSNDMYNDMTCKKNN